MPGGCLSQRGEVWWACGRRGQGEGLGGLADLGGELLEARRDCRVRNRAVAEVTT